MDKLFRQVPIDDRHAGKFSMYFTSNGNVKYGEVYLEQSTLLWQCDLFGHKTYVTHALEEYTLESIHDQRELTATFLVNSIRLLDEQGARHLVKELCERFHLLPSEEILDAIDYNGGFKDGVKWIIDKFKNKQ